LNCSKLYSFKRIFLLQYYTIDKINNYSKVVIENVCSTNVFCCTEKVTTVIDNMTSCFYMYIIYNNMVNFEFFCIFQQHDKLKNLLLLDLI